MSIFTLPHKKPLIPKDLPLTLISLEEWVLVSVQGKDSMSYLQNQLTLDINTMSETQHYLTAHCNAQGKMWSNLRIFHYNNGYCYLVRRNLCKQVDELKKYSIFSKVTIVSDEVSLLGIAGFKARETLMNMFNIVIDINNTKMLIHDSIILLWFPKPTERFILVTTFEQANRIKKNMFSKAQFNNSKQWLVFDIEAGIPIIDSVTTAKFTPQATNLHKLNAINFKKGCYTGQEIIARTKFRNANKLALYWLAGKSSMLPQAGGCLELKINNNWRRTGTVLSSVQLNNGTSWIQAVMNKDLEFDSIMRVESDETSSLLIQSLSY